VKIRNDKEEEQRKFGEKLRVFILNFLKFLRKPVPKSDLVF